MPYNKIIALIFTLFASLAHADDISDSCGFILSDSSASFNSWLNRTLYYTKTSTYVDSDYVPEGCQLGGAQMNRRVSTRRGYYRLQYHRCLNELLLADRMNYPQTVPEDGSTCADRYKKIYADNELNISVFFGYLDAAPNDNVFARFNREFYKMMLTMPCYNSTRKQELYCEAKGEKAPLLMPQINYNASANMTCGFKASAGDPDVFEKDIPRPGLPGMPGGQTVKVKITLSLPAFSNSDSKNRARKSEDADDEENTATQEERSAAVEQYFRYTLGAGKDIVVYDGHSREGGGPDFYPPHTLADGHTDYTWYRKNQPGLKMLKNSLRTGMRNRLNEKGREPLVYASISCLSEDHFLKSLLQMQVTEKGKSTKLDTGFMLSTEVIPNETGLFAFFYLLNSVMSATCEDTMNRQLGFFQEKMSALDPANALRPDWLRMRNFGN